MPPSATPSRRQARRTRSTLALFLAVLLGPAVAAAQADDCVSGEQSSGALYEICLPEGDETPKTLVIYAHGYVFPQQPLVLPETEAGINIREFVTGQDLAYAATSYYANGLVVPERGIDDLRGLIDLYSAQYGDPERVLLLGISNGALLSTLALERFPDSFDGAFASCGPIGSYVRQVDYLADIFVVFEYFFPNALDNLFGVEVGGPNGINPAFLAALFQAAAGAGVSPDLFLGGYLQNVLADPANASLTGQLLGVVAATPAISAAFDGPAEGVGTVIRALVYNVFATNNVVDVLEGSPYENVGRTYINPFIPAESQAAFNAAIPRFTADPDARNELSTGFGTTGNLADPIVALHTTRDGLVPFWQEGIYANKVNDPSLFDLTAVDRYGHCAFRPSEVAAAFDDLLRSTGEPDVLACTEAPLSFTAFDADAVGDPRGEFALLANDSEEATASLDGCEFVVFDPLTERVTYAANAEGPVPVAGEYEFATTVITQPGQEIPAMTLPDSPGGAFALVSGDAEIGDTVGEVLADATVVAALVYREDETVVGQVGNGANDANDALLQALAQLRATAGEIDGTADLSVVVAPNPTSGAVTVAFGLAEAADVRVALYDVLGREVAVLVDGPFGPGRHAAPVSTVSLPAGAYVVRVAVGTDVRTTRLTVVR